MEHQRFDPTTLFARGDVVIFVGNGTTTALDLLAQSPSVSLAVLFSPEPDTCNLVGKIPERLFQHDKYDSAVVGNVIKRQRRLAIELQKELRVKHGREITKDELHKRLPSVAIVIEGCSAEVRACREFQWCVCNGRFMNINVMIALRKPKVLPPSVIHNVSAVVLNDTTSVEALRYVHQQYGGFIDTFDRFKDIHSSITRDGNVMVIDGRAPKESKHNILYYKPDANTPHVLLPPSVRAEETQ